MKTLAPSFSSAAPLAALAAQRAAAPWRVLVLLAAVVLLVHALVLGMSPLHFEPAPEPLAKPAPAMITRSIALAPPVPPALPKATPPVAAEPPVQTRPQAVLKKKPAAAQEAPTPPPDTPMTAESESDLDSEMAEQQSFSADLFMGAPNGIDFTQTSPPTSTTPNTVAPSSPAIAPTPATAATPPASPSQATAITLPASVQLDYKISSSTKWMAYPAKGELVWRNSGSSYDTRMTVSALFVGSRSMSSQGQVGPQGLAPTRFADKSRTERAAHFEPDKGQVSFSANTPAIAWVEGGQDRLSVFMQLGGMLAGNPAAFTAGASVSLYTVGPRDADTWTFQVEGEEMLSLPFGELTTLKLSRQLRHEYDHKLEVWYAPSLGYLPVRNKITQTNGDFVDQQLSAVSRP
jgi:hypothetical protein